jgi:hypothetical protein
MGGKAVQIYPILQNVDYFAFRPHLLTLLMHQASWTTLRDTVDKVRGPISWSFKETWKAFSII